MPDLAAQVVEARNIAMGGTGVASSHYLAAGFANPSLLAMHGERDRFAFRLPSVGIWVSDPDGLRDAIDDFQANVDNVQAKINNATVTAADRTNLIAALNNLNGKTAVGAPGASFALAFPGEVLSVALVAQTIGDLRGTVNVDPADIAKINTAATSAVLDTLTSEGRITGILISELGINLATSFDLGNLKLAVGATPKYQRIDTFNYAINVNTYDEGGFDDSVYRTDNNHFNVDLGGALHIGELVTVGLTARNLIGEKFNTVTTLGQMFTYDLHPTLRAGAAVKLGSLTVAADVDVVEIERFTRAGDESRVLNAGFEFDLLGSVLQLRGGWQKDLEDKTVDDAFSAGVGLSIGFFHLDIAGQYGGSDTYGAAVQTTFTF